MMKFNGKSKLAAQLVGTALFIVLILAAVGAFLAGFAPRRYVPPLPPGPYEGEAMRQAMTPARVRAELDAVLADEMGKTRFLGQPGHRACAQYLRERFTKAGLEVFEHSLETVAPHTLRAELLLQPANTPSRSRPPGATSGSAAQRSAPTKVRLYPFMPNQLQPMNTPAEGISGKLIQLSKKILDERHTFTNTIGLLNAAEPAPKGFGYDWKKYAQLGIRALILAHPDGLAAVDWESSQNMVSANPVNYVRLAADPGIFAVVGKQIALHVRTEYRQVPAPTILGRLKATPQTNSANAAQASEAVVIASSYDAGSLLPDLAPGTLQAMPIAIQLALLDGLVPYQQKMRRDVIFIAFGAKTMALDSQNRLLAVLGQKTDTAKRRVSLLENQKVNETALAVLKAILPLFGDQAFLRDSEASAKELAGLAKAERAFLETQSQFVLNTLVFERAEKILQAKIEFERDPAKDLQGPPFQAFQKAKRYYDKAFASAGYPLAKLVRDADKFVAEAGFRTRLENRLAELHEHHRKKARRLEQELVLHDMFAAYRNLVVIAPELVPVADAPDKEILSFSMGAGFDDKGGHLAVFKNHLLASVQKLKKAEAKNLEGHTPVWPRSHGVRPSSELKKAEPKNKEETGQKSEFDCEILLGKHSEHISQMQAKTNAIPLESRIWCHFSYPAFSLVCPGRGGSYRNYFYPCELPYMRHTESLKNSLQVLGDAVLSAAHGNGVFRQTRTRGAIPHFYGSVYVANVGASIIPNYPKTGALVGCKGWPVAAGYFSRLVFFTDAYGKYDYPYCTAPFTQNPYEYSPDAATYGANGIINYIKDQGTAAQSIYKSMRLRPEQTTHPVNLVLYRATPVSLLDLTNPQTLKSYAGVTFIRRRGLVAFASTNTFSDAGINTSFIKPDERFFALLKAGAPGNEFVQQTRAFMLGTSMAEIDKLKEMKAKDVNMGREISGPGYLAADHPFLLDVPRKIACSMIHVNGKRLIVQNQRDYHMADERAQAFQQRSLDSLQAAASKKLAKRSTTLRARDAATYAMLNHPVLRGNIFEAIWGILWYLGLLVPFVFFFEKLVFGFADIRKQLTANLIIFLVVFGLLRFLHPAFAMIRSSLMILLGFVIMLVSAGITVLFSSKFQENLDEVRRRRGRVKAAEVNKLGVLATAFLLGLNNMHRRRLRTGLTCATLVLLTFVMICFTSVQSDLVDTEVAIGKAPFNGFLVKNEKFKPVERETTFFALQTRYGNEFSVVPRYIAIGSEDWLTRERFYPQITLDYRAEVGGEQKMRSEKLHSILRMGAEEPLAGAIKFLTKKGWFTKAHDELSRKGPVPIMISSDTASRLGITPAMVNDGEVGLKLNGQEAVIHGIFDANSLRAVQDLDGKSLLPFNVTALKTINKTDWQTIIAEDSDQLVEAAKVLLAPLGRWTVKTERGSERMNSIAVVFPEAMPYKESRARITNYLEQSGRSTYYGLDGYSFRGRRARESSFVGLVDMLIPLFIAALTVLNTMKGSVYERQDEIFVYNAVGIAPRYIFFMFFAEAFVYAVVGSVLGYLLSQGTGRILTALQWTGGLNMTFTSMATIYVSMAIAACVFLSSLQPALTARKIATTAEEQGWRLPEPEELRTEEQGTQKYADRLSFQLPFTLNHHDRVAVLSFLERFFIDHGAGGGGPFFAGVPELAVSETPTAVPSVSSKSEKVGLPTSEYIPELRVTIWLKPFDLGVSQRLTITIPIDLETGEYVPAITLERISGTREKWLFLNRRFVRLLRRHFLHWRAVTEEEKQEMFDEAREHMTTLLSPQTPAPAIT